MDRTVEQERSATVNEFYSSLMHDLQPRRRRSVRRRAADQARPNYPRWLLAASVACAVVSLVSAGVAHVRNGSRDVTMSQDEAIRALQTLQEQRVRVAAIEALRRHAIQAVRRLEITRDVDIFVCDQAAEAIDSIRQELQR